jgi:hypothetical protein
MLGPNNVKYGFTGNFIIFIIIIIHMQNSMYVLISYQIIMVLKFIAH